jgi:major membrane immunogen (membrane-anchored lipoprotein)
MKTPYKIFALFVVLSVLGVLATGLSTSDERETMHDGYYTVEMETDSYGWKEFLTIYVNNGKIVSAEYDAKNASGLIKSWDMDYMYHMNKTDGNYPNKYTRYYASKLLTHQTTDGMDAMSGATESFFSFKSLAKTAIKQARAGNKKVAYVQTQNASH